jgi:hypothetical protein
LLQIVAYYTPYIVFTYFDKNCCRHLTILRFAFLSFDRWPQVNFVYRTYAKDGSTLILSHSYATSKLAMTAFQQWLSKAQGVDAVSTTCGVVDTAIFADAPEWLQSVLSAARRVMFTSKQGGEFVLQAGLVSGVKAEEVSGLI